MILLIFEDLASDIVLRMYGVYSVIFCPINRAAYTTQFVLWIIRYDARNGSFQLLWFILILMLISNVQACCPGHTLQLSELSV